jgi:alpha-1,3-mannosyltransferase
LCPQHKIVGCHHGYFDASHVPAIIDLIRRSRADVLLVAMGNPKQELFIEKYLAATGCVVGIGVGALFDFLAGTVPRAMPWVQRWRLEWAYRLTQEPRRLAGRYLVGIPVFLMRLATQWWSGSRLNDAQAFGVERAILPRQGAIDRDIAA